METPLKDIFDNTVAGSRRADLHVCAGNSTLAFYRYFLANVKFSDFS